MIKLSVTGVKEIDQVLRGLPKQLNHRVLGQAHAAAAKPLINKAKVMAPKRSGGLQKSIGAVKLSQKKATIVGEVHAGPRRGRGHKGYAAHLVEFGTKKRTTKRGANRGVMSKKPFMEPSFQATKGQVEGLIAQEIGRKLNSFMKRTLK